MKFSKLLSVGSTLLLAAGLVTLGSTAASATGQGQGHTPVNICHATSSDSNPYVFITVDDDSVKYKGHLEHRNHPNKTWKSAGTFNGQTHKAGQAKPDLIEGLDGDVTEATCEIQTPPTPTPSGTPTPTPSATPPTPTPSATPPATTPPGTTPPTSTPPATTPPATTPPATTPPAHVPPVTTPPTHNPELLASTGPSAGTLWGALLGLGLVLAGAGTLVARKRA